MSERQLSDAVYCRLVSDAHTNIDGPEEDTQGDYNIQRGQLNPHH